MSKVTIANISTLDRNFSKFTRNTRCCKNIDQKYVISQLKGFQTSYSKSGVFQEFLIRLESFALEMENSNLLDIAGIVYSKLAKLPTSPDLKERFLEGGLRVARKQKDPIHTLARIVDLKKLYEQTGEESKRFGILFQEESTLETIITNFSSAKNNYRTVAKESSPIKKYKQQLARTKVDIAKRLRPEVAYARLLEAKQLFLEACDCNGLNFVEKLISQYTKIS